MIRPSKLQKGDKVRIISTARKIEREIIEIGVSVIQSWGLDVDFGKHLFSEHHQFAGTDAERATDLQEALDDEDVKAIFFARGGYGSLRIIDGINFSKFQNLPKWLIGYSDITVIHCHLQNICNSESLHASMPVNFKENTAESLLNLKRVLFGESIEYQIIPNKMNIKGKVVGELTGGNLSILYALQASVSFPKTKGKILFIEDIDEYLYHIDRMMLSLKRSGCFEGIAGLVVGGLTDLNDNKVPFGKNAEEIISEIMSDYNIPVCFGFPAGHLNHNNPIIMGRQAEFIVENRGCSLKFNF